MTEARLTVHVRDRPDVLERVLGLLRRRAIAVRQLSLAARGEDGLVLGIRVDASRNDPVRVRDELLTLRDVTQVDIPTEDSLTKGIGT